jgi:hypothetical protein
MLTESIHVDICNDATRILILIFYSKRNSIPVLSSDDVLKDRGGPTRFWIPSGELILDFYQEPSNAKFEATIVTHHRQRMPCQQGTGSMHQGKAPRHRTIITWFIPVGAPAKYVTHARSIQVLYESSPCTGVTPAATVLSMFPIAAKYAAAYLQSNRTFLNPFTCVGWLPSVWQCIVWQHW